MEKELRRNQSILRISGIATIVFGYWSLIKTIAYYLYNPSKLETIREVAEQSGVPMDFVWVMLAILILLDIIIRFYIGRSAMKEARGVKHGYGYIVFAVLLIAMTLYLMTDYFDPQSHYMDWDDVILSVIVDLSSVFVLAEMVVSAIRVKLTERKMRE